MPFPLEESLIRAIFEIVNQSSFLRLIIIFLGSILPWIIIIWFIITIFCIRSFKLKFYYFSIAIISAIMARGLIAAVIHNFFYIPRPFEVFDATPIISHPLTSGLISGYMALLVPIVFAFIFINKQSGIIASLLVILAGIARVVAGIYWGSALLAGILIGALSFLFVKKILLPVVPTIIVAPKADE